MIGVDRLSNILATVAASSFVGDGKRRISVQLIAPSDAGKTELLLAHMPPGARVLNDVTTASLFAVLDKDVPPAWIVIPDLNQVISHKPSVVNLTFACLLAFLGEGVTEIPGINGEAKLKAKRLRERGITISLLTGMTPDMFSGTRGRWRRTGLLRRMVPINYTYSPETAGLIQRSIKNGKDLTAYGQRDLPSYRPRPVTIPPKIAALIEHLSVRVTEDQLSWKRGEDGEKRTQAIEYPFSVQKMLRTFARATAIRAGRSSVILKDYDAVLDFSAFVRYDRAERI